MAKKVLDEEPKKTTTKKVNKVAPTKEEAEVALEEVVKEERVAKEAELSKKNSKTALIVLIGVVVAAIVGVVCFFGYRMFFLGKNPVKITSNAIRGLKENIKDFKSDSNGMFDLIKSGDPFEIKTKLSLDLPNNMGSYSGDALIQADAENETFKLAVNAKQGKKNVINFDSVLKNSKMYFKLSDTMKNYYYIDASDVVKELKTGLAELDEVFSSDVYNEIMKYDYSKFIDYLADAIDDSLSNDDFDKSSEEITVVDKDVKATKYTAKITQAKALEIAKNFVKRATKDKDLMKLISEVSDLDEDEIKEALNEILEEEIETDEDDLEILYSVYVSKFGKTLGYGFEVKDMGSVLITNKGDKTAIDVSIKGDAISEVTAGDDFGMGMDFDASIIIDKKSDDHYVVSFDVMGFVTGELDINSKFETVKKNKEYKANFDLGFKLSMMGQSIKASFDSDTTIKKIDEVDTTGIKNAINGETMTEYEKNKAYEEFTNSSLYQFISGFISTASTYTNQAI